MHGFPGRRTMTLRCELFGQAGDYALTLRPAAAAGPQDLATAFIKVSDDYVTTFTFKLNNKIMEILLTH